MKHEDLMQQAAIDYGYEVAGSSSIRDFATVAFLAGVRWEAMYQNPWKQLTDCLPNNNQAVLVGFREDDGEHISLAYYRNGKFDGIDKLPDYWMPIKHFPTKTTY